MILAFMVTVPYWWHATILEAIWLSSGLVSTAQTVGNILDAWKDNAILDEIRDDPAVHTRHYEMVEVAAHYRAWAQYQRMGISLLIVAAGVIGVLTSNPTGGKSTLTQLAVTAAFAGISALTAVRAHSDSSRRNRLYELARDRTEARAARLRGSVTEKT